MQVDPPRPISDTERSILDLLLDADFPGVEELRAQVDGLLVVGRCDCGCPSVDFAPGPGSVAAAGLVQRLVPNEAIVRSIDGEPAAEVIAFVDDGFLSGLELVSYADVPPQEWPHFSRFERRVLHEM